MQQKFYLKFLRQGKLFRFSFWCCKKHPEECSEFSVPHLKTFFNNIILFDLALLKNKKLFKRRHEKWQQKMKRSESD